jgi:uncharacterized protein YdhG (YjbR/CyaY superfamily)
MNQTFDDFVQTHFPAEYLGIVTALRDQMRESAPEAREDVSYNMPVWKQHRIIAYLTASQKGITFGFPHGVHFEDRHHLLRGTAKWARHIRISDVRHIPAEALRDYVRQALALDAGSLNPGEPS